MHQLPDQGNAESSMIYGASELPNTGSLGDQISLAEIVRCCLWNILMNWERDTSWSDPLFRPEKLPDASWHPFKPLVPIYLWVKNHGGHQNSFGCSCPPSIPIPSMTFQNRSQEMELQSPPWHCNLLTSWPRLIFNHFMPFGHNMPRHHRSVHWVSPGFKCVKKKMER